MNISTVPARTSHDLSKFRYHTGAQPTPLEADEPCPPLFRDIGVDAMCLFMRGELPRLCGPTVPITYLRTADYREPYTDYGMIGRIMLLNPHRIQPWRSGIDTIFIAPRDTVVDFSTMAFIPAEMPLLDAATRFSSVRDCDDLIDAYGRHSYHDAITATLHRLRDLTQIHQETERLASPLRRQFQSSDQRQRDDARAWMDRLQLAESDLCTAWHHLPIERREYIQHALLELPESFQCPVK